MATTTDTQQGPARAARMGGRLTQPRGVNPYDAGGLGYIPRPWGVSVDALLDATSLASRLRRQPLAVLDAMRQLDPMLGEADDNVMGLLCPPGGVTMQAVRDAQTGEDATDDAGTAALEAFGAALPPEIGGWDGLLEQLVRSLMYTGMACLEAVPAALGGGLSGLWPVDARSIEFKRDPETGCAVPHQWQVEQAEPVPIDPAWFQWRTIDAAVDDLFGIPWRAPYLNVGLQSLSVDRDLDAAIHFAGWPRLVFAFDFAETMRHAQDPLNGLGMAYEDALAYTTDQMQRESANIAKTLSDDAFVVDKAVGVSPIAGGNFAGMEGVLNYRERSRVRGLKTRPFLLGLNDTTTETQAREQLKVESLTLERLRARAVQLLVWAANLHLRLLGLPLTAHAECAPIRSADAYLEAQTQQLEIANAEQLVRMGFRTPEEASIQLTGSGVVDPARAERYFAAARPRPTVPMDRTAQRNAALDKNGNPAPNAPDQNNQNGADQNGNG